MNKLKKVFTPIKIGKLEIKNRVVFPPMVTNYASKDGFVTERLINYIRVRAEGGVGLVITENTAVNTAGRLFPNTRIDGDKYIPGLKDLFAAIHEAGAKAGIQLDHEGRETTRAASGGMGPIAPSPITSPTLKETPREMTIDDIKATVEDFGGAARRAKEAGADCVEIQGAHGFLINQFMSPHTNRRNDEYGGDLEGRIKFVIEVIRKIKEEAGEDFPLICRISGDEFVEGGLTLLDMKQIALILVDAGADAIHVSAGILESIGHISLGQDAKAGMHVYLAEGIKEVVDVPVITVGKIPDLILAEEIIGEGKADLAALGRSLLADPNLPNKCKEGKFDDIVRCTWCNACFNKILGPEPDVACTVNPHLGREGE